MQVGSRHLIIGVDGGGTGCRVGIETLSGKRVATVRGGAANYTTDPGGTLNNVCGTLMAAIAEAGFSSGDLSLATAHVGLAGVLDDAQSRALSAALPFTHLSVSDDRVTSAAGALGPADGVVAAVGTGSFVVRRHDGTSRFFGGWGLQVGDHASGAWLGRLLLERCLIVVDGLLEESDLSRLTLGSFHGKPQAIVSFAQKALPRDYAEFAPSIIDAARAGDTHGLAIMRAGAQYLIKCIAVDQMTAGDIVCLAGGVGPHYAPYFDQDIQNRLRPARGSALDGALDLARENYKKRERAV